MSKINCYSLPNQFHCDFSLSWLSDSTLSLSNSNLSFIQVKDVGTLFGSFFLLNPTSNPLGHPIGFTLNIFRIQLLFYPYQLSRGLSQQPKCPLSIIHWDKCLKHENSSPIIECSGFQSVILEPITASTSITMTKSN